jgi:hypothetical protein
LKKKERKKRNTSLFYIEPNNRIFDNYSILLTTEILAQNKERGAGM